MWDVVGGIINLFGGGILNIVLTAIATVFHVLNWVLSWLTSLAIGLFETVISQSFNTDLFNATFIQEAWMMVKEFSNLVIVFFLIIIAAVTILDVGIGGLSSYNAKKILPKLIFVALAVNFSLVIAKFILDIVQSPMFFIAKSSVIIGGRQTGIGEGIRYLSEVANVGGDFSTTLSYLKSIVSDTESISLVAREVARFLILLFLGAAMLTLAINLLLRIIGLWFIMILAPISWVISILPFSAFSSALGAWWRSFFGWASYGFMAVFFMYLTAIILRAVEIDSQLNNAFNLNFNLINANRIISNLLFSGKYLIAVVGMWMALSWSKRGSDAASETVSKVGELIHGYTVGKVIDLGKRVRDYAYERAIKEPYNRAKAYTLERAAPVLQRIPGMRGWGLRAEVKARQMHKDIRKDLVELYKQLPHDQLLREIENPSFGMTHASREESRRIAAEVALERNSFRHGDITAAGINRDTILNIYNNFLNRGDIEQARKLQAQNARLFYEDLHNQWLSGRFPGSRADYDEQVAQIIGEMIRAGEHKNLKNEDMYNSDFMRAIYEHDENAFSKILEDITPARRRALDSALKGQLYGRINPATGLYDDDEMVFREMRGRLTNDLNLAFIDTPAGLPIPTSDAIKSAKRYVQRMREDDFRNMVESKEAFDILAQHFTGKMIGPAGQGLSDNAKREIVQRLYMQHSLLAPLPGQPTSPEFERIDKLLTQMRKNDNWVDVIKT